MSKEMVDDHRNMLMLSKKLSDFQVNNMKGWVAMFFPKAKGVQLKWDFIKKDKIESFYAGKIEYDILFERGVEMPNEELAKAKDYLEACTKFMFWSETKVVIKRNGKIWKMKTSQKSKSQTSQKKKNKPSKTTEKTDVRA